MQRLNSLVGGRVTLTAGATVLFLVLGGGAQPFGLGGQEPSKLRDEKLENLLTVIRDRNIEQSDPKRFLGAIQELGRLRAVEAVHDLVGLLTYERDWGREERTHQGYTYTSGSSPIHRIGRQYPATLALAEIGKGALPALTTVVMQHDETSLESTNANFTIRIILARHGLDADTFFKDAAAKAPTPEASQRLLKAPERLENSKR